MSGKQSLLDARITSSPLDISGAESVAELVDDFVTGQCDLTGLELYLELERRSALLQFHTILREGARNQTRDGIQQSYGDHNRLLMHGLDRLLAGDVDWYRAHVGIDTPIPDVDLETCLTTGSSLVLSRPALVALWLGAALHDCGTVHGRGAHVDVEDGVVMSRGALDRLCPAEYRALAEFVLHNHDYIKDAFVGEMAIESITEELATLPVAQQPIALAALGCVQVAGAASLGTGRLTPFRLQIFDECIAGTALEDRSPSSRLARLLETEEPPTLDSPDHAAVDELLARTGVHGWHSQVREADTDERLEALRHLSTRNRAWRADHIVWEGKRANLVADDASSAPARVEIALSGARVAILNG